MNCKEIEALLIDYVDKTLDEETEASVKNHLAECAGCSREAEELRVLFAAMRRSELELPDPVLRDNFNTMLQSEANMLATSDILLETQKQKPHGKEITLSFASPVWRVAAAVILLGGGIAIGMALKSGPQPQPQLQLQPMADNQLADLRKEIKELKESVMFNLIDDESASQRIKAVSYSEGMANPDHQVINVLFNTLNRDKNANVRLAALYSLARFADIPVVRDSLISSLGIQTDPIVQVVLINLLAEKRERRAIAPIQRIITNKTTLKEVKDAAQKGLKVL
jgi:Putative zinc-finger